MEKKHKKKQMDTPQNRKKSIRDAQTSGFMCLLVYFVIKGFTLVLFYNYDNYLKNNLQKLPWFIFLLIVNTYLMLTTGKNPGFYCKNQQNINISTQQNTKLIIEESENIESNLQKQKQQDQSYCNVCNHIRPIRTRHCYGCGRCIRKFDHHCPWIGGCVGQFNHFKFLLCLLAHTLQSVNGFIICIKTLDLYKYHDEQSDVFSSQFGIFAIWTIFLCFYILFAGGLLIYHSFLVMSNQTTRELMSRYKCSYLKNIKGNPFNEGVCENIKNAMLPDYEGRDWQKYLYEEKKQINFWQKIWKNDYYECC